MKISHNTILCSVFFVTACASVPRESVTLSSDTEKGILEAKRSHHELVRLLYDKIKKDVNRFVDEVYAPEQIRGSLANYQQSLIAQIKDAAKAGPKSEAQSDLLGMLQAYLEEVRNNLESYRAKLLSPVVDQETLLSDKIDRHYEKLSRSVSVITAHLSSVAQVNETQDRALEQIGLSGARESLTSNIDKLSSEVSNLLVQAQNGKLKIAEAKAKIERTIGSLGSSEQKKETK